ncbi:hypothetical protein NE237_019721 [Protea cynaroides]|uniref:Uncharacterized protein n=1 Tax=Protea cynaroides TaxID=273540 RepID=A0A9Q0H4N3_9MAGN|nr:hypothetical protein NE237_019721 [Protea cynaroides]
MICATLPGQLGNLPYECLITTLLTRLHVDLLDERIQEKTFSSDLDWKAICKMGMRDAQSWSISGSFTHYRSFTTVTDLRVGELLDAQCATDGRVGELLDAQRATDGRVGELLDAQRASDQWMAELTASLQTTQTRITWLTRVYAEDYDRDREAPPAP